MLTNLSWLEVGSKFPPACEQERLAMYEMNKALFESRHVEVYEESLKRIQRVIGNFQEVVSYPVILNFQKLLSLKTADLLLGEPPRITAGDSGSTEQKAVDSIIEHCDLFNTLYMGVIDISRYGDGLLLIRPDDEGGLIDLTQPPIWFPVVSTDNVREITNHVLAWTWNEVVKGQKKEYLKARVHYKGYYEEFVYELSGESINKLIEGPTKIETGLDDFAIIQVSNTITSDRATGIDDYTDVDSIIAELMVRVGQIARILDKHASPSMSGPQASLERDPVSGEWRLKAGNYFPRDNKDDPTVQYITWDGELGANFNEIDRLINMLYTISEMGSAIFGDLNNKTGAVPSGSALKRLMIAPLAKVSRIRQRLDPALKKAVMLCSKLGGEDVIDLTDVEINITWNDGLPEDPKEMADIMNIRTGNKATISQLTAIKKLDGLDDDGADEELAKILDDEQSMNPMAAPIASQNPNDPSTMPGAVGSGAPAAAQGLDRSQTYSLLSLLNAVKKGTLSPASAIAMITTTLPVERAQAEIMVRDVTPQKGIPKVSS
jgi:Phage portal protein, SPP1 Gp6-like